MGRLHLVFLQAGVGRSSSPLPKAVAGIRVAPQRSKHHGMYVEPRLGYEAYRPQKYLWCWKVVLRAWLERLESEGVDLLT